MSEQLRPYEAILPCGGRGTRLAPEIGALIKPLLKVGGQELIRYSLDNLRSSAIKKLIFAVDYGAGQMKGWLAAAELDRAFAVSTQTLPGVLGAIKGGLTELSADAFTACNTDEVRSGFSLEAALASHEKCGLMATMIVGHSTRLHRHRVVEIDPIGRITKTTLKPEQFTRRPEEAGLVNTGFLILERGAEDYFDFEHSSDWSGLIDPLCDAGQINAYVSPALRYFNVGTPPELEEAAAFLD